MLKWSLNSNCAHKKKKKIGVNHGKVIPSKGVNVVQIKALKFDIGLNQNMRINF